MGPLRVVQRSRTLESRMRCSRSMSAVFAMFALGAGCSGPGRDAAPTHKQMAPELGRPLLSPARLDAARS